MHVRYKIEPVINQLLQRTPSNLALVQVGLKRKPIHILVSILHRMKKDLYDRKYSIYVLYKIQPAMK